MVLLSVLNKSHLPLSDCWSSISSKGPHFSSGPFMLLLDSYAHVFSPCAVMEIGQILQVFVKKRKTLSDIELLFHDTELYFFFYVSQMLAMFFF